MISCLAPSSSTCAQNERMRMVVHYRSRLSARACCSLSCMGPGQSHKVSCLQTLRTYKRSFIAWGSCFKRYSEKERASEQEGVARDKAERGGMEERKASQK